MGYLQPQLMNMQDFFTNSVMSVPEYQRSYAWEEQHWGALWSDVHEGLVSKSSHFLGMIILRESRHRRVGALGTVFRVYDVVDGQQRLTTISLLLLALYAHLGKSDWAKGVWRSFIEHDGIPLLELGPANTEFYRELCTAVWDGRPLPQSPRATNIRMAECLEFFQKKLDAAGEPAAGIVDYLRSELQTLRFITDDEPLAIKTFQTINDRGKQLTLLEKTKSLLMLFVSKYLDGDRETFQCVQDGFGSVYEHFDTAMDLAKRHHVDYLSNPRYRFGEGEVLTFLYHYAAKNLCRQYGLAVPPAGEQTGYCHAYAYWLGADAVFDHFLKPSLGELRGKPEDLRGFVRDLMTDLVNVSESLAGLMADIADYPGYQELFQRQGLSASVYPLIIGLRASGMLDDQMLRAVSVLDLRVYKIRGTDPRAQLYNHAIAEIRCGASYEHLRRSIVSFMRKFGSDEELDGYLRHAVYRQAYVRFVLWEMARHIGTADEYSTMAHRPFSEYQVEHILSQTPSFDVTMLGYESEQEYITDIDRFGNLCLLEQDLQKKASNRPVPQKANVYASLSKVPPTQCLGSLLNGEWKGRFGRSEVQKRTEEIIAFIRKRWPIPEAEPVTIPDDSDTEG